MTSPVQNLDDVGGINDLVPFVATIDRMGHTELAIEIIDLFASKASGFAQLDNIAKCYFKLKQYEKSIKYGEYAHSHAPNPEIAYTIRCNLINVYNHANYPEKALRFIEQNEKLIPNNIDTTLERAFSLFLLNRKQEAETILNDVLEKSHTLPEDYRTKVKFNLGTYKLYRDRFQEGLRLFLEEGAKINVWKPDDVFTEINSVRGGKHTFKKWDGKVYPGRPVILHAEAGIGDEIINVRFTKHIQQLGMVPYWLSTVPNRKDLIEVFKRNGIRVITRPTDVAEAGDVYHAQSMHAPMIMGLEYKDLWDGPYIKADPIRVDALGHIFNKQNGRKKVAIRWQGNPAYDHDLHRSVPLKDIYEAVKHIDADFYCIQRDTGLEEFDDFPGLINIDEHLTTWEDTLAVIENVDCVVTSCTSVLHATAALGKKTYALIPISAYYTWSHSGQYSPWYGEHVEILRQERPRKWTEPLQKLSSML